MPERDSSALRYDVEIDPAAETSHTRVLRMVGRGKRVLDLGCATGSLAAALGDADCTVVGVEFDPDAAELAKARCERVLIADLETVDLHTLDLGAPFDVVVAADVLEHLRDPQRLLRQLLGLFAPHGYLLTSIPNVAHGSVRLALLGGQFRYRDLGLLDHTHLRFFTRSSMLEMLAGGGFTPVYVERQLHPATGGEVLDDVPLEELPAEARTFVEADPEAGTYQFVSLSFPGQPTGGLAGVISRLAQEAEELIDLRAELARREGDTDAALEARGVELLAARDAATRTAVDRDRDAERIAALELQVRACAELETERAVLANELLNARARLEAIHASRLWRVAGIYRGAVNRARGR